MRVSGRWFLIIRIDSLWIHTSSRFWLWFRRSFPRDQLVPNSINSAFKHFGKTFHASSWKESNGVVPLCASQFPRIHTEFAAATTSFVISINFPRGRVRIQFSTRVFGEMYKRHAAGSLNLCGRDLLAISIRFSIWASMWFSTAERRARRVDSTIKASRANEYQIARLPGFRN